MEDVMKDRIEELLNHIMKKCLWQFNSRAWDRKKQNENILKKAIQLLCDDAVEKETLADKCYWVEAVSLVDNFKKRYPWLNTMSIEEIRLLITELKERLDYLTITGSLNLELTDPLY